jgi:hypothetical protein
MVPEASTNLPPQSTRRTLNSGAAPFTSTWLGLGLGLGLGVGLGLGLGLALDEHL